MANIQTFPMPDVGEGLTEAEILTWHVAVGDTLTVNQIMVEIETAKAAVELPSPYAGVVRALLVEPGITVDVGTPIISIDTDPGRLRRPGTARLHRPTQDEPGAKIGEMTADGRIATLVGYVSAGAAVGRRARKPTAATRVDDLGFDVQRVPRVAAPGPVVESVSEPVPSVVEPADRQQPHWRRRRRRPSESWPRISASTWPPSRPGGRTASSPERRSSRRPLDRDS